jgi:hypothetical protein
MTYLELRQADNKTDNGSLQLTYTEWYRLLRLAKEYGGWKPIGTHTLKLRNLSSDVDVSEDNHNYPEGYVQTWRRILPKDCANLADALRQTNDAVAPMVITTLDVAAAGAGIDIM